MAQLFSEKAQAVLNHLQANAAADLTAKDIAAATGIEVKSINGVITGLQKKGYVVREEAGKDDEGKTIKYIRLTAAGASADPTAEKPEE